MAEQSTQGSVSVPENRARAADHALRVDGLDLDRAGGAIRAVRDLRDMDRGFALGLRRSEAPLSGVPSIAH